MAISPPVGLTNLLSQVGASNRDTASVTVEAGDLIVVTAGCSLNGAIGAFTITGLGATWVIHEEAEVTVTGLRTRGCVATALIPSGTSGVINVAVASGNPLRWNIAVEQIQADTALSVVQTEIAQPGTGTTHQVTLPGSPGAASLVFGGLIVHETTADDVDNDPDFTEGYDSTSGGATIQSRVQTQYRNGGADAVVDWSGILTGANKIGIGLEIAEEGGGGSVELVVADMAVGIAADAPALTQKNLLAVADASVGITAESPALTQKNLLAVADMAVPVAMDAPALVQKSLLAVADAAVGVSMDNVGLLTGILLDVAALDVAVAMDSPALLQAYVLAVQDALVGVSMESPALVQKAVLAVQAMDVAVLFDNVTLSLATALTVADLAVAVTIDGVVLTQDFHLAVQDILVGIAMDSPGLIQANVLAVNDALVAVRMDNVVLVLPTQAILIPPFSALGSSGVTTASGPSGITSALEA